MRTVYNAMEIPKGFRLAALSTPLNDLSLKYGVSPTTVRRWAKACNVRIPTKQAVRAISEQQANAYLPQKIKAIKFPLSTPEQRAYWDEVRGIAS